MHRSRPRSCGRLIASPPEGALATEPDAILRLWTLKESAVKAVGLGLRLDVRTLYPLDRLPLPGSPVRLIDGWSSQAVRVGEEPSPPSPVGVPHGPG